MPRPRRPVVMTIGIILVTTLLLIIGYVGLKGYRTAENLNKMIVPQVTLPTEAVAPTTTPVVLPTTSGPVAPTNLPLAPTSVSINTVNQPIHILLLGTDRRRDQLAGRTDAIALLRIDPQAKRASLLSLPRDLWVSIPGHGENRLNSAYFIGETEIGPGYGPALAKKTVGTLTGLQVDYFVMINLDGFAAVVDKVGGINIDVPEAIDDPQFPTDDGGTMHLQIAAGCQKMNGEQALQYARTRHQDSDFGRIRRQQQVLSGIFNMARSQGLFTQLNRVDEFTDLLKDDITTDLSISDMLGMAQFGSLLRPDNIHRYQLDGFKIVELAEPATFKPDPEQWKLLLDQYTGIIPDKKSGEVPGFAPTTAAAVECK